MKSAILYIELVAIFFLISGGTEPVSWSKGITTDTGNPLLPGYFADPTVKKFGDTYYIYATTDGIKLASGEPQVWISKDFVNWYNYEMDIRLPKGLTNCWAPDVVKAKDGRYYYFMGNCQLGCNIYGYVSDLPVGPWKPVNHGKPVIPIGTGLKNLPALDAQFLRNENGSISAFFGTWCSSFGGMGWADIDATTMDSVCSAGYIPMKQIPHAFEAACPLKRDSIWFLMYSSGDCRLSSYAVHYAWARHPHGPYIYGQNNPILSTNEKKMVDGPGHHSVLKENGHYYIVYHRHDNPHSTGGEFRQVCADKLNFTGTHRIAKVIPTSGGVGYLGKNQVPFANLAKGARASASSFCHLVSRPTRYMPGGVDYSFRPQYAIDDNNGTIWKAGNGKLPQSLVIDLGREKQVKRVMTQFEYPTYYYQYRLEVSSDSMEWKVFADRTDNRQSGSPMIDDNDENARYIRMTVTGTEKTGMYAAIWNIKVYDHLFAVPPCQNAESKEGPGVVGKGELLVNLSANGEKRGVLKSPIKNKGTLSGRFECVGQPEVRNIDGVKAFFLDGESWFTLSREAPESLNWNAPFTASVWMNSPDIGFGECLLTWTSRRNMLQASYAALMYGKGSCGAAAHGDGAVDLPFDSVPARGKWHNLVLTFDGMCEYEYVDGKLNNQQPISLFVRSSKILIGASGDPVENFTGAMTNIRLYDQYFTPKEIGALMEESRPGGVKTRFSEAEDNNI
ncbi:family 43 glycosylhydrolase [Prolixibacter sp. NT017]|uniref:family 43 glycosylhydrolase n=1 Tax=Prolixibacter sp. NT017 TaxID=2652390 RepID=UPI00127E8A48|nr:family 43 glycosylhydrolase [Prolixibacter sp. NT017]GET25596.1 hypothetical protein NT017_19250 [Prolixibacter sp. NT017]